VSGLSVTQEVGRAADRARVSNVVRLHQGGGSWSWVLGDLKTLLETGEKR
jgi:hypothetical protein